MKIVIDIPDILMEYIVKGRDLSEEQNDEMALAIANGTPLPKEHGELIDYECVVDAINDWINTGEYNYTNATNYLRNRVKNIPIIIKADKGE